MPDDGAEISAIPQIGDGSGRCIAFAMRDARGIPARQFEQGESAHFHFDFALDEDIGSVSGGIEISDESGRVVHGKDTFQRLAVDPIEGRAGSVVRFHVEVELRLGIGHYRGTIGLASVDARELARYREGSESYLQLSKAVREHLRVVGICTFEVIPRADGRLSHHGLADLPGSLAAQTLSGGERAAGRAASPRPFGSAPTVYHVTHWKAGSQWLHRILAECAPERIVAPMVGETQFRHWALQAGRIYPTVYVNRKDFDAREQPGPFRVFVVIRDLRDTLVSGYFSMKVSHAPIDRAVSRLRDALRGMSFDAGMVYLMDEWLPECARIQLSWLESGARLIRYEELLRDDIGVLEPLLIEECGIDVPRERLRRIIVAHRFQSLTGRAPGVEDVTAHERKGVHGDWRNHFSEAVKRAFKARFGGVLAATGYEQGLDW
jgi:lipopolysaccharide transport system ATP-binding protein